MACRQASSVAFKRVMHCASDGIFWLSPVVDPLVRGARRTAFAFVPLIKAGDGADCA